ncbi:TRAP transporter small permease subunit [Stappia sp. ES.058]|uniref:TRAP transporter small permease subunit n=1 Tax=Stappia sp. ES.058 TaxID=1881061 RepID=UPI00087B43F5|nr:TRAP transporter small permease [Stappia sp. ES.058]SDT90372.1 TRAP-type mannitol/chloroaromatic compound transport system, small permease component [Stappia sp. ES.058]
MTSSSATRGRPETYIRFDGWLATVENAFNMVAAASILALMLLAVMQIVGRNAFNLPVPGFIDITEQAMAVFAFMGVAYCQRLGGHIRMELFLGKLSGRPLWIAECVGVLLIWLVVAALVYGSWFHFKRSWSIGDSTIDIGLPTWPSKLVIPVALSVLLLRLTLQIYGYLRLVRDPQAEPIAVPVLADIETQARHEIEETFDGAADGSSDANTDGPDAGSGKGPRR